MQLEISRIFYGYAEFNFKNDNGDSYRLSIRADGGDPLSGSFLEQALINAVEVLDAASGAVRDKLAEHRDQSAGTPMPAAQQGTTAQLYNAPNDLSA